MAEPGFKFEEIIAVPGEALFDMGLPMCDDPTFIIHLLPASVLLDAGCTAIPRHEDIIDRLVSKTAEEIRRNASLRRHCIFVSHRWVNNRPDSPDNSQLAFIRRSLRKFKHPESFYVWIDYSCMRQDTADLPTIKRLNYILSHCDLFMLVLPDFDPKGHGYIKRVWCIYEWLACIHFKKIIIISSSDVVLDLLSHSLRSFFTIIHPNALVLLEHIRVQCRSYLHVMTDVLYSYHIPDLFMRDEFISSLEAYKEEDKAYVYDNIGSMFSIVDVLYLIYFGRSDQPQPFMVNVSALDDASVEIYDPARLSAPSSSSYVPSKPPGPAAAGSGILPPTSTSTSTSATSTSATTTCIDSSSDDESFDRAMRNLSFSSDEK